MKRNVLQIAGILILCFIAFVLYGLSKTVLRPQPIFDLSHSSVVTKIQSLNRLETAQYTFEKIIDAGYQGNFFQNVLYGDRILLIAHAKVVAGFDLSKIVEKDITISSSRLTITLPPPEIFNSILDNSKTKVYDRRTGLLASEDKDLESQARLLAEEAIRKDACTAGILDSASMSAKNQLELLFRSFGFTEVEIIIPEGNCN